MKIIAVLCFMLPGGHGDCNCVIFLVTRGGGMEIIAVLCFMLPGGGAWRL